MTTPAVRRRGVPFGCKSEPLILSCPDSFDDQAHVQHRMTLAELEALVSGGESEQVEFKKTTGQRTLAAKTVCAMLNGKGGFVLFGVTDAGTIRGQQVTADTVAEVVAELRRIEPVVLIQPEVVEVATGRSVVALRVPGEGGGPYVYDGRPYERHGPTTSPMSQERYRQTLLESVHAARRWENEPVPENVGLDDLDHDQIRLAVRMAQQQGRLGAAPDTDLEAILRGFELIRNDRLVNAAVVLFGQAYDLQVLYPQCSIRMARFRGVDRLAPFDDNRAYWGHAFDLLGRAERFLMDHVPIAGRVVPGNLYREDRPKYPPRATREALANAFCHRDYSEAGGAVAVALYDDRLEISNPGRLPFGQTPEQLQQPHPSRPWNPLVAGVFYRAGIIERWGTGTTNMIAWCREGHTPPPTWSEWPGAVVVTFHPARPFEEVPVTPERPPLPALQEALLGLLAEGQALSMSEILNRLDPPTPRRTVHENLSALQERGLVELVGKGRGARWQRRTAS